MPKPQNAPKKPEVIIITGDVNSGKSLLVAKLARSERAGKLSGIIARGVFKEGIKIGFDLIDLSSGVRMPLARTSWNADDGFIVGKYIFSQKPFALAKKALLKYQTDGIVFLDEAGPLELRGEGYADCLKTLLASSIARIYVVVRSECLTQFVEKFISGNPVRIVRTDSSYNI